MTLIEPLICQNLKLPFNHSTRVMNKCDGGVKGGNPPAIAPRRNRHRQAGVDVEGETSSMALPAYDRLIPAIYHICLR